MTELPARLTVPVVKVSLTEVMDRESPSGSESLASNVLVEIVVDESSSVLAASLFAEGLSLTPVIVTVTVAMSGPPVPSLTV